MPKAKAPFICNGDDTETELPWKWAICGSCNGDGTTSRHVECDGGGFTSSEWREQDEEFRRDYLAGAYARECDYCQNGKVKVVDRDCVDPGLLAEWDAQRAADREIDEIQAMERRMGA